MIEYDLESKWGTKFKGQNVVKLCTQCKNFNDPICMFHSVEKRSVVNNNVFLKVKYYASMARKDQGLCGFEAKNFKPTFIYKVMKWLKLA